MSKIIRRLTAVGKNYNSTRDNIALIHTVLYLNNYKRNEVITMPRTKGSKNRPKTNTTKDYASQIAEKQETVGKCLKTWRSDHRRFS